jgi:hypothetical protein
VGWAVGRVGSRRVQSDRLDDQRDDQAWAVERPGRAGAAARLPSGLILTMDRQSSAVLTRVFAARARPLLAQLWAQFLHHIPAASTVIGGATSARRRRVLP